MKNNEVYSLLQDIVKDHEKKETALKVVKTTLELHLSGENTDLKFLLELVIKTLGAEK